MKAIRKLQFFSFAPDGGLEDVWAIRGRAFIRAIQSMQTSKSPQHFPALGARGAVSYHGFMYYAGSGL